MTFIKKSLLALTLLFVSANVLPHGHDGGGHGHHGYGHGGYGYGDYGYGYGAGDFAGDVVLGTTAAALNGPGYYDDGYDYSYNGGGRDHGRNRGGSRGKRAGTTHNAGKKNTRSRK